jgi:hypothetical protein
VKTLLGRVQARLERQAARAESASRKERRESGPFAPGSVLAEIRAALPADEPEPEPDVTPESLAAGKAAFEALRGSLGSSGPVRKNGLATAVGAVLPSVQGAPSGLSLTVGRGSERQPTAVSATADEIAAGSSSPRGTGSMQSRTEPGERVTDPPRNHPTVG